MLMRTTTMSAAQWTQRWSLQLKKRYKNFKTSFKGQKHLNNSWEREPKLINHQMCILKAPWKAEPVSWVQKLAKTQYSLLPRIPLEHNQRFLKIMGPFKIKIMNLVIHILTITSKVILIILWSKMHKRYNSSHQAAKPNDLLSLKYKDQSQICKREISASRIIIWALISFKGLDQLLKEVKCWLADQVKPITHLRRIKVIQMQHWDWRDIPVSIT